MQHSSVLLSVEDSAREGRSLLFWTQAEREGLAAKVRDVLTMWQADFLPPEVSSPWEGGQRVCCEVLQHLNGASASSQEWCESSWIPLGDDHSDLRKAPGAWWSFGSPGDVRHQKLGASHVVRQVKDRFFGVVRRSATTADSQDLGDAIAAEAWEALCQRLRDLFGLLEPASTESTYLPSEVLNLWSGALVIAWDWCGQEMRVVVTPSCVRQPERSDRSKAPKVKPSPLAPVLKAAAGLPVVMQVELQPMDIKLGALLGLRIGDIVQTTHLLEAALLVKRAEHAEGNPPLPVDETPLFRGLLGKQGSQLAIALTSQG